MLRNAPACIMIIAGEASGDSHGAKLVRALGHSAPNLFVFGIGGKAMQREGVRLVADAADIAVVGITEILPRIGSIIKAMFATKRLLRLLSPDLVILIDFPGFNLSVAAAAKKMGIPVLYYISPQIWAWRSGRVNKIARCIDHMAVILPFEADFYAQHRIPVTYVGHPLLDDADDNATRRRKGENHRDSPPVVGLLPGSREREITRLLPEMLKAAGMLEGQFPLPRFVISIAPTIDRRMVSALVDRHLPDSDIELSESPVADILRRCTCVVAASGTVTLEAAIAGVPMVIVYRVSPLSYWLGRMLVRGVKHIGLVNLIAGREVVPELIQSDATASRIAEQVAVYLSDRDRRNAVVAELQRVRSILGGAGASEQVAAIVANMLVTSHQTTNPALTPADGPLSKS